MRAQLLAFAVAVAASLLIVSPGSGSWTSAGEQARAGAGGRSTGADRRELPALRTRTSRTYVDEESGLRVAEISTAPLNYRGPGGDWLPIDNTLVADGGGFRNRASDVTVRLPGDLASAAVLEQGGARVAFALEGGVGRASVRGAEARYQAGQGVEVVYEPLSDGLKETVVLADASTPPVFGFSLELSQGLSAREFAEGGVEVVDATGAARFVFSPPVMVDAAGVGSSDVSLRLVGAAGLQRLVLSADRAWLAAPERRFPVRIDPTILTVNPTSDCTIRQATPDSSDCTGSLLEVGSTGSAASRALLKFDISSIPKEVVVLNAELELYLDSRSTTNAATVDVHALTRAFTSSATWNRYDGTNSWTSPGGDYLSPPAASRVDPQPAGSPQDWYPTKLVQEWVDGTRTNNGFLLKTANEGVNQLYRFRSVENAPKPELDVYYEHRLGIYRQFTYESQQLGDRREIAVNVANGNLTVHETDFHVAGIAGHDLVFERWFNSLATGDRRFGNRWDSTNLISIRQVYDDGSVAVTLPTGYTVPFIKNSDGSFTTPTAVDATLTKTGTAPVTWTLKFNKTGLQYVFNDPEGDGAHIEQIKDQNGNVLRMVTSSFEDTRLRHHTITSSGTNLIQQFTDDTGRTYQYGYDGDNLTSYTDPDNKTTTYAYNATSGNLTRITDALGNQTRFTWRSDGRIDTVKRVTNNSTGAGLITSYQYPAVDSACPSDSLGKTISTDPRGNTTTYCYDRELRVTKTIDDLGRSDSTSRSPNGDITSGTNKAGGIMDATYDTTNNLIQVQGPLNGTGQRATSSWLYQDASHPFYPTAYTNPQQKRWNYAYDTSGNLCAKTEGVPSSTVTCTAGAGQGQNPVKFTYNANGTAATATDAKSNVTTYGYNGQAELTSIDYPGSGAGSLGTQTFTYDSLSRLSTYTDGKGQTTTVEYDPIDRIKKLTYHDASTTTFTYDANGNLLTRVDSFGGTSTYGYDKLNRLTSEQKQGKTITYTYYPDGLLNTLVDASGTVTYGYDDADRVNSIDEPHATPITVSYPSETRAVLAYPNTVSETMDYDDSGRLTQIEAKKGATTLTRYSYTYTYQDGGGQTQDGGLRGTVTDKDGNLTTFTYDTVGRLTRAQTTGPSPSDYQYSYDANGNRTLQIAPTGTTRYAYDVANQLCWTATGTGTTSCGSPPVGATTYTFDAAGNETQNSLGIQLGYNIRNQNTSQKPVGGSAVTLQYAGPTNLERTFYGTTEYVETKLGLSREGATVYYTRTPEGQALTQRRGSTFATHSYYLHDGLGSVVAQTSSTGTVQDRYTYDPFGAIVSEGTSVPNSIRFASGHYNATQKLYKFGLRYYDPSIGRWTQQDALNEPLETRGWNLYAYAADDPVNLIDPAGTCILCSDPLGIGGFVEENVESIVEGIAAAGVAATCIHVGLDAFEAGAVAGAATGPADPAVAIGAGLAGCAIGIVAETELHDALG